MKRPVGQLDGAGNGETDDRVNEMPADEVDETSERLLITAEGYLSGVLPMRDIARPGTAEGCRNLVQQDGSVRQLQFQTIIPQAI